MSPEENPESTAPTGPPPPPSPGPQLDEQFNQAFTSPPAPPSSAALAAPTHPNSVDAATFSAALAAQAGTLTDEVGDIPSMPEPQAASQPAAEKPSRSARRSAADKTAKPDKPAKATKSAKLKDKSQSASGQMVNVVPVGTSFDLLEGSYQTVLRTRLILMVITGVIGAIGLIIISIGLQAQFHTQVIDAETSTFQQQTASKNLAYSNATSYQGIAGLTIREHVTSRSTAAKAAATGQINAARILADVQAAAGPDATISAISIGTTAVAPPATPAPTTGTTIPGATTAPTTAPTTTAAPVSFTVTVITSTPQALENFIAKMKTISYLSSIAPAWSGQAPAINATITATITDLPGPIPPSAAGN